MRRTVGERFEAKVNRDGAVHPVLGTPCHLWTGAQCAAGSASGQGYGHFRVNGQLVLAHRFAWEQKHGPIPDGKELDHLCRNHPCVNDEHLEPVTHLENARRGLRGVLHPPPTHCLAGHPLGERRRCLVCKRISDRAHWDRNVQTINAKRRARYAAKEN